MAVVPKTVILIGAPGAGKTSQATVLAQKLPAKSVSPGQMLRDLKGESVIGHYMKQFFVRDALADIAWELIEREIVRAKTAASSIVLEGTPRSAPDTFRLQKKLKKNGLSNNVYVILLNISPQDLAARMKVPRAGREAEDMAARHKTFTDETGPLLKALHEQGLNPIHVDANGTMEQVTQTILDAIKAPGVEWKIDNPVERVPDVDEELSLVTEKCDAIESAECAMRLIAHSSMESFEESSKKRLEMVQKRRAETPKFPGSQCNGLQPVHLDPQQKEAIEFRDYCVTTKADGTRYLVAVVHNAQGLWMKLIDRNLHAYSCFAAENKREGKEDGPGRMENPVTILDAELVRAKDSHVMLLVFDCLCVKNRCIVNHPLQSRVEEARALVAELRKAGYAASTRSPVVDVTMKGYEDAASITPDQFDGLLKPETFPFSSDGLIFTPKGRYHLGFDRRLLKWKPLQEYTADFRVKKVSGPVPDPNDSSVQCVILELFVIQANAGEVSYASHGNYGFLNAGESVAQDIDQKVVELSWNSERFSLIPSDTSKPLKGAWVLKRVRADKPRPNVITVVKSIVESLQHPELSVSLGALKTAIFDSHRDRNTVRGGRGGHESEARGRGGHGEARGDRGGHEGGGRSGYERGGHEGEARGGRGGHQGEGRGGRGRYEGESRRGGHEGESRGGRGGHEARGGRSGYDRGGYEGGRGGRGEHEGEARGGRGGFGGRFEDRGGRFRGPDSRDSRDEFGGNRGGRGGDFQRPRGGFHRDDPHERQSGFHEERRRPQPNDTDRERHDNTRPRESRFSSRADTGHWRVEPRGNDETRHPEPRGHADRGGKLEPENHEESKETAKQTPDTKPLGDDNRMAALAVNPEPEQPESVAAESKSTDYYAGVSRKETAVQPLLDWHNAIKRDLYKRFLPTRSTVLELAGGRGGDLWKIMACKPLEILLVDADQNALTEARSRWEAKYGTNEVLQPILQVQQQDLRKSRSFLTTTGALFDFVSCHFALHYFFESAESWNMFVQTLNTSVKPGAYFIATLFDGEKVEALLNGSGGSVSLCRGALGLKFEAKAEGAVTIHLPETDFGKALSVRVDTIGSHTEYVVRLPRLVAMLGEAGWDIVEQRSFKSCLESPGFARAAGLTPMGDAEMATFSALNSTLVFRRRTPQ